MTWPISPISASSSWRDPIGRSSTSRCSASSWRTVPDAARHALPARLVAEERRDPQHDLGEVHRVVEEHHDARAERRAGGLRVLERELEPEVLGPDEDAGGPAEQHRLQLATAPHPTGERDQLAERHAVLDLVHAGRLDAPGQAEQSRARRVRRAELRVLEAAHREHLEHVHERLDVVDTGRLAEQALLDGERRLVARLAALALDRVEQRGLLAADVRAGAAPQLDVEGEALAHHVVAEEASGRAPASIAFSSIEVAMRVLAPDVEEPLLRPGREAGDRQRLDHRERVVLHQDAVLEGAGLGLVRVADEVVRAHRLLRDRLPLHARGNAAPPRPSSFASFSSRITPSGPSSTARRSASYPRARGSRRAMSGSTTPRGEGAGDVRRPTRPRCDRCRFGAGTGAREGPRSRPTLPALWRARS